MPWVRLSIILLAGCATPQPGTFQERLLDVLPEETSAKAFRFTRDGRIAAYVRFHQGSDCVVVGGKSGKPLSLI